MRKIFYKFMMLLSLFFLSILNNITNAYTTAPPSTAPIGTTTTPPPSAMAPNIVAKDDNITVDVQTIIAQNNNLSGLGIMVSTTDGVVTLTGSVNHPAQAILAISLAKSIKGVKDVQSKIVVKQD